MQQRRTTIKRTIGAVSLAAAASSLAAVAIIGIGSADAETPAERCKRETSQYNDAWKQAWVAAHPGKTVDDAPNPNPPYRCGGNDDAPPTLSPSTSSAEAPTESTGPTESGPSSESSKTPGPSLNPDTERTEPESGVDGRQPAIGGKKPSGPDPKRDAAATDRTDDQHSGLEIESKLIPF